MHEIPTTTGDNIARQEPSRIRTFTLGLDIFKDLV